MFQVRELVLVSWRLSMQIFYCIPLCLSGFLTFLLFAIYKLLPCCSNVFFYDHLLFIRIPVLDISALS
jgi:hypothetical protein